MPEDAPAAKADATRGYGAEIVTYDRWTENREEIGARLAEERGLELVKPYDDPLVMAGQGTTALELLADVPELDVLVAPVGGGGLIAGCATVAQRTAPAAARRRRRARSRRRHRPVARRGRARPDRRAAHDRGRAPGDRAGRADLRGEPRARGRDRHRERRGDRRRDGVPLRPDEARRRAERRRRRRGAPRRARRAARGSASCSQAGTSARRGSPSFCGAATEKPARSTSTTVCSAAATSASPPGQLAEHPAGEQLVDAAVEDDRGERRVEVGAELARRLAALDDAPDRPRSASRARRCAPAPRGCARSRARARARRPAACSHVRSRIAATWRSCSRAGSSDSSTAWIRSRSTPQFSRKIVSRTSSFDEK